MSYNEKIKGELLIRLKMGWFMLCQERVIVSFFGDTVSASSFVPLVKKISKKIFSDGCHEIQITQEACGTTTCS